MKTIDLKGKTYATFDGVLDEAHKQGLVRTETEIIQLPSKENPLCIVKAFVKTSKGEFVGHGDASENNVNRMIVPHLIRMAETRALGRALRFATNAATLAEELGDNDVVQSSANAERPTPLKREFSEVDKVEVAMEENETSVNLFMRHKGMIGIDQTWRDAKPEHFRKIADHKDRFFKAVRDFG
jgi:hypothetical protein